MKFKKLVSTDVNMKIAVEQLHISKDRKSKYIIISTKKNRKCSEKWSTKI